MAATAPLCHAGEAPDRGVPSRYWWRTMLGLLVLLLIIWLVLAILGFVIKGLFWLAILGIILFLATSAYGAIKRSTLRR